MLKTIRATVLSDGKVFAAGVTAHVTVYRARELGAHSLGEWRGSFEVPVSSMKDVPGQDLVLKPDDGGEGRIRVMNTRKLGDKYQFAFVGNGEPPASLLT